MKTPKANLTNELNEKINLALTHGTYKTRSEFVRAAVREHLVREGYGC